ncbi:hypothetical protein [Eupransor demetentiae]|uniref:Thioredoxin n=1 Tax=Eupransor demetentiae TaxID=3109584 RepID=A0ABM9N5P5_9LACO|nr:hypothetical protein R54876_GBNLAHCA_01099 [Lactobacillaceae bacterium LMG 33000]
MKFKNLALTSLAVAGTAFVIARVIRRKPITDDEIKQLGIDPAEFRENIALTKELSLSDLEEKLDGGESFDLFIGSDDCPFCRYFSRTLKHALEKRESAEPVYHFDLHGAQEAGMSADQVAKLKDRLAFKTIPHTMTIKAGHGADSRSGSRTSMADLNELFKD